MTDVPPQGGGGITQEDAALLSELGISPEMLLGPGEAPQMPSFPGVPDDAITAHEGGQFTVPSPGGEQNQGVRNQLLQAGADPANLESAGRELRWTEADVFGPMARSGAEIQQLQDQLVTAGLLPRGGYVPGIWDKPSQDGMRQLLGYSNLSGREPDDLLTQLSGLVESERQKLRNEAIRRATSGFLRQDDATVQSVVKGAVKGLLRRDPTDQEMAEITAHWRQFEQEDLAQQQQQAAAQAEFEAGLTDQPFTGTDVNPEARLEGFLSERFAGTIAQNQRVEEMNNGQHNLLRNADRIAGMMSRG